MNVLGGRVQTFLERKHLYLSTWSAYKIMLSFLETIVPVLRDELQGNKVALIGIYLMYRIIGDSSRFYVLRRVGSKSIRIRL